MEILDAQVHAWEPASPRFPWDPAHAKATGWRHFADGAVPVDDLIPAMDEAGVTGALLVTPQIYGFDNRYSLEAAHRHPGRFGVVGRVDPHRPDVDEQVQAWKAAPAAAGIRIVVITEEQREQLRAGAFDRLLQAAERHDVPVAMFPPYSLSALERVVRRFTELRLVIDHLGLAQPPLMTPAEDPLDALVDLVALARYPNVSVKVSGVPTLSGKGFPFADTWPYVERTIEAFGADRTMWGSDYTRVRELHSYTEAVDFACALPLSSSEKRALHSETLRRVFQWTPPSQPRAQTDERRR